MVEFAIAGRQLKLKVRVVLYNYLVIPVNYITDYHLLNMSTLCIVIFQLGPDYGR